MKAGESKTDRFLSVLTAITTWLGVVVLIFFLYVVMGSKAKLSFHAFGWTFEDSSLTSVPSISIQLLIITMAAGFWGVIFHKLWGFTVAITSLGLLSIFGVLASIIAWRAWEWPYETRIDWSWLILVFLIAYLLKRRYFIAAMTDRVLHNK